VARNGQQFQVGLQNRESRNSQFDFLQAGHPYHTYFLQLVESYTRCLLPPKDIVTRLQNEFGSKTDFLEKLILRAEWDKQEKRRKDEEEAKQKELSKKKKKKKKKKDKKREKERKYLTFIHFFHSQQQCKVC
jgi:splicing factor 3A subunit 1